MSKSLEQHKIVSEKEWIKARKSLLKKESVYSNARSVLTNFAILIGYKLDK